MSNKQQQNRAKKQEKRRLKSKAKAKAYRVDKQRINASMKDIGGENNAKQRMSVYDIIQSNDLRLMRQELKRRRQEVPKDLHLEGESADAEGEVGDIKMTGIDLLRGINDMITVSVKLHSGLVVFLKLAEEGRFVITESQQEHIDAYEAKLVEFCEDVHAVTTLHHAGRKPIDYLEIVIHITDVMDDLVSVHRDPIFDLILTQQDAIEAWATEHKPADVDTYTFMSMLHEQRINSVVDKYATKANDELVKDLLSLDAALPEEPILGDDLNLEPSSDDVGEDEPLVAPQDPVTEAHPQ